MASLENQTKQEQKPENRPDSQLTGQSLESNKKSTEATGSHDLREALQAEKKGAAFNDRMGAGSDKKTSSERPQRGDFLQSSGGGALPENKPPAMASDSEKNGSNGNKERKESIGKESESKQGSQSGSDAKVRLNVDSGDSGKNDDKLSAREKELTKKVEKLEGMKEEFKQQVTELRKDVDRTADHARKTGDSASHEDWHRVTGNAKSAEADVYRTEKVIRETNEQLDALRKERQQSGKS